MTELIVPVEDARRAVLLAHLSDFVQSEVDREVKLRRAKLDGITTTNNRATRAMNNRWSEVFHFQSMASKETMAMLESYDTETLEHVWQAFVEEDKGKRALHAWASYNGKEWNRMSHGHRDAMFRDILAMRGYTSAKAEHRVHSLLETYRALGLKPGDIHSMPHDEMHVGVAPVFLIACGSRGVVWMRSGIKVKTNDHKGNWIPPVEPDVDEEYRCDHLTPEAVDYVIGFPKRSGVLWNYMAKHWQTLKEMDFELFLLQQETHPSLVEGVL